MMVARQAKLFVAVTAVLVVAAAIALLLPDPSLTPPPTRVLLAERDLGPATQQASGTAPLRRTQVPNVFGLVVNPCGQPVANVMVGMDGSNDVATSAADGTFTFCSDGVACCHVKAGPGWVEIVSPVLEACQERLAPTLVVSRARRLQGRVVDGDGAPVVGASVGVEVALPIDAKRSATRGVRSARIRSAGSTTTDRDGWYHIRSAATGENVYLVVEHPHCKTERLELRVAQPYFHCTLQCESRVPTETQVLQRATGTVSGWLLDEQERPRAGWWVAIVSGEEASVTGSACSRFARLPVRADASGRFTIMGVLDGDYRIEAWHPRNHGVVRSPRFAAPAQGFELVLADVHLPDVITGSVVDQDGECVANAVVGIARPSGWAVPGRFGMHVSTAATTDRHGNFEVRSHGLAGLELIVAGEPVVPRRVAVDALARTDANRIRVVERHWLASPLHGIAAAQNRATSVVAVDEEQHVLSTWLITSPMRRDMCVLKPGVAVGFPVNARQLIWRAGQQEVGRLIL